MRKGSGHPSAPHARHRFGAFVETLAGRPSFLSRAMFGCIGCYLEGRLVLVLADRGEPWQGLLLPVERAAQADLRREFPALRVHRVLPKWLYLAEALGDFEALAGQIIGRIAEGDARFGVEPKPPRLPRGRRGTRRDRPLR